MPTQATINVSISQPTPINVVVSQPTNIQPQLNQPLPVQTNQTIFPITANQNMIGVKGDTGNQGNAGTIQVGSVDTVEPTIPASIENVGTPENAILNFFIPKGIQGDQGTAGDEVSLQKNETHIQWKLGDGEWTNLVALTDLTGAKGEQGEVGATGAAGTDGREIELQKSATHIQWRYVGDVSWTDLVALADLKGADGLGVPAGGLTGEVLKKTSETDFDTEWGTIVALPPSGSTGQVLAKASNDDGDAEWIDPPVSDSVTIPIAQATHGFNTGDAIYFDGSEWALAKSDSIDTIGTHIADVIDVDNFNAVQSGKMTVTAHGFTVGAWLYVDNTTAGLLTETEPLDISNPIAQVIDANTYHVHGDLRATGGADNYLGRVKAEVPAGTLNGINTDFTVEFDSADGKIELYKNGVLQKLTTDYSLDGTDITMVVAPLSTDLLLAYYDVQIGSFAGGNTIVVNEIPSGTIDGVNKDFVIDYTPVSGTLEVDRDGQAVYETDDWTLSDKTITFVTAPASDSKIRVSYQRQLTATGNASTIEGKTVSDIIDLIYPVGSIFITTVSANPGTYLGGTWEAFGAGRTLVGLDSGQTEFDTVEETGGVKEVTLTSAQSGLKAHSHVLKGRADDATSTGTWYNGAVQTTQAEVDLGTNTKDNTASNASEAHTNLQPYIVTYMFKRTA